MYHLIRHLGQRFHVDLVGAASTDAVRAQDLCREWCQEVEFVEPRGSKNILNRLRMGPYEKDATLEQRIHARLSEKTYAAIHVEKPAMLPYIPTGTDIPIILDLWSYGLAGPWRAWRNQSGIITRCRNLLHMTRLGVFDSLCWPQTRCLLVVSDEDRIRCERARPKRRVLVVPNGVEIVNPYRRVPTFQQVLQLSCLVAT